MKLATNEIATLLFRQLFEQYAERVPGVNQFIRLVGEKGGQMFTDHLAFRTFNTHTGEQPGGIRALRHLLNFLGYNVVSKYVFPKKMLKAAYFEHSGQMLPKIFVSQLEVDELPGWAQGIINNTVKNTTYLISDESIGLLRKMEENGSLPSEAADYLVNDLIRYFRRPWNIPLKDDVLKLNDVSQYGAWVLLHGNSVNHFAALTNPDGTRFWPDLETIVEALANSGVPMLKTIAGEAGSKLRQAATIAVKEEVNVKEAGNFEKLTWTYAYFEIVERNFTDENGRRTVFPGFIETQTNQFFDITQTLDN